MKRINIIYVACFLIFGLSFLPAAHAAPGDLDFTFSGDGKIFDFFELGGNDRISDVAFQSDGRMIAVGSSAFGGLTVCRINRYNTDGTVDPNFGALIPHDEQFFCNAVEMLPDGKFTVLATSPTMLMRFNADGTLDTSFDGDGKMEPANMCASAALARQPDGKYLIIGNCGFFPNYNIGVFRFNADGTIDNSFDTDGRVFTSIAANSPVADLAVQTDGKIVVAANANSQFAVVRYNTDGSLDNTFDGDGIASVAVSTNAGASDVLIQTDGKIVVSGSATVGVAADFALARLNTDGSLDASFDGDGTVTTQLSTGSDGIVEAAIQPDGKIVAIGSAYNGSNNDFAAARYNPDGSLDTSFDTDGKTTTHVQGYDWGTTMLLQADGGIVVAGYSVGGDNDFTMIRYNAGGSLDTSFDGDGKSVNNFSFAHAGAKAVAVQPDGKIVAGGWRGVNTSNPAFAITRYNTDGSVDWKTAASLGIGTHIVHALAIQSDGKIIAAGQAYNGPDYDFGVVRLNSNGTLDTSFDGDGRVKTPVLSGDDYPYGVAVHSDGKIVVAGYSHNGTNRDISLVRYNANGSLDTSFDGDGKLTTALFSGNEEANAVAIQPDGKILVAGYTVTASSTEMVVVRYNTDGSLDTSFDGDGSATVSGVVSGTAMTLQSDGKIVVAGYAGAGGSDYAVARFNTNGSLDTSFDGDGKTTTDIYNSDRATSVGIQPNGKIVVAGYSFSTDEDFSLARYNTDGSLDTTYSGDGKIRIDNFERTDDFIYGMAIDRQGRAVVAGETNAIFTLARFLGDAVVSSPFDFDGDTRTDISIFRPSMGEWWYLRSSDNGNAAHTFGNSSDKLTPADFTGDGKTDIAFFRPSTGDWFVLRSEDYSYYAFPFGISTDIPTVGDFDGDDLADPAVYRGSEGNWYIRRSTNGGTEIQQFGIAGDVPVPADYDADGKTDNAIYRPSNGQWWIRRSSNDSVFAFTFGTSSDKPVQGDYTGDGKADAAIFRPSTGEWFILRSEDYSFYSVPFGASGDIPAPGDYDGDGKFDTAVFRPSNSTWYVNRTTSGIMIVGFGISGDTPVPAAFVP